MPLTKPTGPLANYRCLISSTPSRLTPLSKEEMKTYIYLSLNTDEGRAESAWDAVRAAAGLAQILDRRLGDIPLSVIKPDVRLLASLFCDRPGVAVMWAYTLALMASEMPVVSINEFSLPEYFGWGVPSPGFLQEQWEAQKAEDYSNYLDRREFWPQMEEVVV